MEKPLAEKSGLGWQGKHTNLVSRDFGSWLFLGIILVNHSFEYDSQEKIIVVLVRNVLIFAQQMHFMEKIS